MTRSVGSKCFSAEGETAKIIDFLCEEQRRSNPAAAASRHHILYLRLASGPEEGGVEGWGPPAGGAALKGEPGRAGPASRSKRLHAGSSPQTEQRGVF